jgi:peptide/nickel transport system ATP-binding protein
MDATRHTSAILSVSGLSIEYRTERGTLPAVRNATLDIAPQQSLGLVGESGSGKSTLAMGALRYLPENGRIVDGTVRLRGTDLASLSPGELREIWGGQVGIIYQNPLGALNPSLTIGRQLREMGTLHLGLGKRDAFRLGQEMLTKVAMPDPESVLRRYPHQLSGGMLQRCVIAMALMTEPSLLIMDEPTTALDVTTQAVVLDLVRELKRDLQAAILYITHDLGVVARICDRIAVMYAGEIVEMAPTRALFKRPRHPYSLSLLGCVPHFDLSAEKRTLVTITGAIPHLDALPPGCIFAPRCRFARERCTASPPPLTEIEPGRSCACYRWSEVPPPEDEVGEQTRVIRTRGAGVPTGDVLLQADDVYVALKASGRSLELRRQKARVHAVDGVSAFIRPGDTLGLVGESGSGKTTFARAIVGLTERTGGQVVLRGRQLEGTVEKRPKEVVREIQMVFQNPDASLNPRHTVGEEIGRPLSLLRGVRGREREQLIGDLLASVNLPANYSRRYPGELSGGEKQRVAIARACAADPALILCDEPISSLDVSVQGTLMNLLMDRQAQAGTTFLFISHDLSAVEHMSDAIAVMYLGRLMELGPTAEVMRPPFHPYTEALLSALPVPDPDVVQDEIRLGGVVPSATEVPTGCRFHTRCPRCLGELCVRQEPPWQPVGSSHWIYCHIPSAELAADQVGILDRQQGLDSREASR